VTNLDPLEVARKEDWETSPTKEYEGTEESQKKGLRWDFVEHFGDVETGERWAGHVFAISPKITGSAGKLHPSELYPGLVQPDELKLSPWDAARKKLGRPPKNPIMPEGFFEGIFEEAGVPREEVFIQAPYDEEYSFYSNTSAVYKEPDFYHTVRSNIPQMFRRLGVDYVDSLCIPNDVQGGQKSKLYWEALESFVEEGKIRAIGLRDLEDVKDLRNRWRGALKVKPSFIQAPMEGMKPKQTVQSWRNIGLDAAEAGMVYQAVESLQTFYWFFDPKTEAFMLTPKTPASDKHWAERTAAKYNCSVPQLVLRFLMGIGVSCVIGGREIIDEDYMKGTYRTYAHLGGGAGGEWDVITPQQALAARFIPLTEEDAGYMDMLYRTHVRLPDDPLDDYGKHTQSEFKISTDDTSPTFLDEGFKAGSGKEKDMFANSAWKQGIERMKKRTALPDFMNQ